MKKQILSAALILSAAIFLFSCEKSDEEPGTTYQIEKINKDNFSSLGWREQQVNNSPDGQIFLNETDYIKIVCDPGSNSDPYLKNGSIEMNLPTTGDPTLRRIRLRREGYTGTRLADITELKYSTYVIRNSPSALVLQIDFDNDGDRDGNIFYNPVPYYQGNDFKPVELNTWQEWNTLQEGKWHIELIQLPEFPQGKFTIQELVSIPAYAEARIIDTPPVRHNGEGVRFTLGGDPIELFVNTIGYLDALIIGTKNEEHSTLFDFACN